MKQRRRIYYSAAQRSEIWDRWQAGEPMSSIGRRFDRESSSVFSVISPTGGIRPPDRHRAKQALSLSEREEISRWLSMRCSLRSIARHLGRSPSTISREVQRNGGADRYRAARSDQAAWDRARRPKLCKLACRPFLRRTVSTLLRRQWSPEQIAGWLKRTYPGEPQKQVSHETIYRSLFIQARGVLKKELLEHLRARRTVRRSRHASMKRNGLGQIKNAVSISERPPSVEDRAVPGHWEGDLIGGSGNSYVATLVERHSRYVMLVKVANKDTESVVSALIKQSQRLPSELYRSLTWDRGKELADHQRLTLATEVEVYFCDPRSPWQRGSNENTNRLLRQYLPRGTDLSLHSQASSVPSQGSSMKGRERPCSIRRRLRSSQNVLQRSVEPAAQTHCAVGDRTDRFMALSRYYGTRRRCRLIDAMRFWQNVCSWQIHGSRPAAPPSFDRLLPQFLRIDVDHQRREQDQAADQDLQETVDVDVVEAVVEDAEHEQPDDGVADAAAAAEQAGAADHDGGDRSRADRYRTRSAARCRNGRRRACRRCRSRPPRSPSRCRGSA